jgi:hypothetical protein
MLLSLSLVRVMLKLIILPGAFVAIMFSDFSSLAATLVVNIDLFSSFITALGVVIDVLSFLAAVLVANNDGFSGVTSLYTRRLNRLSSLFENGKVMIGVSKSFWLPV